MTSKVRKTIREYGMISAREHVVVAASGGADSTALLLCLNELAPELHFSITVAHLNHGIRGPEGDADEDFVRRMSAELGLPFVSEFINVKGEASATKQNLEQLARQKRYDFLNRVAHEVAAQKIAIGHSLNDQAETALFRFLRGSGMEGLSSIYPVVGGRIIRPLLECSREDILAYLKQQNAIFREDSTNRDLRYARNRIRHEMIPYLEKNFNRRIVRTIGREASLARETWDFLNTQAESAFNDLRRLIDNGVALKIPQLLKLHPAMQKLVLRHGVKTCLGTLRGITAAHVERLLSLCVSAQSGGQMRLPREGAVIRQFDELSLLRCMPAPNPEFKYELSVPGECRVREAQAIFIARICPVPATSAEARSSNQAFLEPAALPGSIIIRPRKPGDRYGGAGHSKVKKLLIDHRIPRMQRPVLPMVTAGEDVIWIPGLRPAKPYAARPESGTVVVVEFRVEDA